MKTSFFITPLVGIAFAVITSQAQTPDPSRDPMTRPRTVAATIQGSPQNSASPAERQAPQASGTDARQFEAPPQTKANPGPIANSPSIPAAQPNDQGRLVTASSPLPPSLMRVRITEAERLLKSRPLQTAMTVPSIQFVTVAAFEGSPARLHLLTLPKETFLKKGAEVALTSSLGTPLSLRVLRANGVNTAVTVFDNLGRSFTPLVVEFPIEKGGVFREMAYYTSAHPALLSAELVQSGKTYVHMMLDLAANRLREKGAFVSPQIVNVAERLCLVEHVDHERFRAENQAALFDEIYSLYGLNDLDTYRYSVSTAGAGGMVQMIPWAYNLIKQRHPAVGLNPDFVVGMRNHLNALQAMLLYMQDTWNDLAANEEVQYSLGSKIATQTELLAAGYNSNAAKLPQYLRRGGTAWRTMIPRETQMYLQIYKTVDALVPMKPRTSFLSQGSNPSTDVSPETLPR